MNQPWRPDWTDKSSYPNVKATPSLQWAWEFLRRNDPYQQLWNEMIGPIHDAAKFDDAWKTFQRTRRKPGVRLRMPPNQEPLSAILGAISHRDLSSAPMGAGSKAIL